MLNPYAKDALRLKAEIVARAGVGEYLNAISASPGMPSVITVRKWSRADPLFGADLAQARRRGEYRRLWVMDEAVAAAFLARARAGEPIHSLLGRPGMPSQTAYRRWKTAQAPFAEAAFALLQRRNARTAEMGRARRKAFDQTIADKIIVRFNTGPPLKALLASDPELPSREVVSRWRREQPEFHRVLELITAGKRRRGRPVPQATIDDVVAHIVEGGTFLSYSRLPDGPAYNTLRRWMRDPNFAREVAQACDWREERYADQILMISEDATSDTALASGRSVRALKRQVWRLRHRPRKPLYPEPKRQSRASPERGASSEPLRDGWID